MTLDELLQQLMKIKEIYPDSGKFLVNRQADKSPENEYFEIVHIKKVMIESNNEVVIK